MNFGLWQLEQGNRERALEALDRAQELGELYQGPDPRYPLSEVQLIVKVLKDRMDVK